MLKLPDTTMELWTSLHMFQIPSISRRNNNNNYHKYHWKWNFNVVATGVI